MVHCRFRPPAFVATAPNTALLDPNAAASTPTAPSGTPAAAAGTAGGGGGGTDFMFKQRNEPVRGQMKRWSLHFRYQREELALLAGKLDRQRDRSGLPQANVQAAMFSHGGVRSGRRECR